MLLNCAIPAMLLPGESNFHINYIDDIVLIETVPLCPLQGPFLLVRIEYLIIAQVKGNSDKANVDSIISKCHFRASTHNDCTAISIASYGTIIKGN